MKLAIPALIVTMMLGILTFASIASFPRTPQCAEDVVLVGVGAFDNGRYDSYECGPAFDDYVGMD